MEQQIAILTLTIAIVGLGVVIALVEIMLRK